MRRVRGARAGLLLLAAAVCGGLAATARPAAQDAAPQWTADLSEVRATAARIPGRRALRVNVVKFAESRRTKNFSVRGAPVEPSVQARTAFQLVFADGTVMVDAGMDRDVHRFFGRGAEEPYDAASASALVRALTAARLIVVTHEHGDHVAGVVRSPLAASLAPKTLLTRAQAATLQTNPQMPEISLTEESARRFIVFDYERYFPLAPGVALIKAAGHTPGSQMIYAVLESSREYLFIGDTAWHMDDVRLVAGKDAPWVTEDRDRVLDQLRWLNSLSRTEPDLVIVASHDEDARQELVGQGLLGEPLD